MTLHLDDRVFSLNVKSYILMCINIYTWICARVEHIWHIFIFSNSEATTCFCLILAIYLIREPQRFCVDPFKGSSLNLTYYMWHCPHTIFGYLFWPTRDISVGPLYTRNHSSWTFTSSVHLHIYICCYICTICIRIMIRTIYQLSTKYQHGIVWFTNNLILSTWSVIGSPFCVYRNTYVGVREIIFIHNFNTYPERFIISFLSKPRNILIHKIKSIICKFN